MISSPGPRPLHVGPSGGAAAVRPATPRTGDRVCFHLCVPGTADTEPVFERDREARAERGERHARPFPYACRGSRSAEQPGRRERRGAALMGGRPPGLSLRRRTADSPARDKNCELRTSKMDIAPPGQSAWASQVKSTVYKSTCAPVCPVCVPCVSRVCPVCVPAPPGVYLPARC